MAQVLQYATKVLNESSSVQDSSGDLAVNFLKLRIAVKHNDMILVLYNFIP